MTASLPTSLRRSFAKLAAGAALTVLAACGNQAANVSQDPLQSNPSFAAIPRDVSANEVSSRQDKLATAGGDKASSAVDANQSFYLAVSKAALGQKFFFTGYLKQFSPGGVYAGAAESMGTRIISFQVQNGKLFVFDASAAKKLSDTFDPTTIIEAYPIVTDSKAFSESSSSSRYILVDPASGLNNFNLLSDAYASDPSTAVKFTVDLSFLQNFRQIADGVTYEQVFTGAGDQPLHYTDCNPSDPTSCGEPNTYRASGTLGVSIRAYSEGGSFKSVPLPRTGEYYFRSDPTLVANGGGVDQTAAHWDIHPGMKPISWKISPSVAKFQALPQFQDIDIAGALKKGVENWNQVFGFKALEASVASAKDSFGNDDTNYVIFDEDPNYGAAFANWRTNPDTGEIRGASVYYSSLWLLVADYYWPSASATATPPSNLVAVGPRHKPTLSWGKDVKAPLCLRTPKMDEAIAKTLTTPGLLNPAAQMSAADRKATIEAYLTHVLVHEIGHTLGLRHNFRGSLVPPTNSVMEYVDDFDAPSVPVPQAYDTEAVQFLYGLAAKEPSDQQFCTDEQVAIDADCARFDTTSDPYHKVWKVSFDSQLSAMYQGAAGGLTYSTLAAMNKYIAEPPVYVDGRTVAAFHAAFDKVAPPLSANDAADANHAYIADLVTVIQLEMLYSPTYQALLASAVGVETSSPYDPKVTPLAVGVMRGVLLNTDGARPYDSRRIMVDMLKDQQRADAYQALADAQAALTADVSGGKVTGTALLDAKDLLARVTAAVSPYYK